MVAPISMHHDELESFLVILHRDSYYVLAFPKNDRVSDSPVAKADPILGSNRQCRNPFPLSCFFSFFASSIITRPQLMSSHDDVYIGRNEGLMRGRDGPFREGGVGGTRRDEMIDLLAVVTQTRSRARIG